MPGRQCTILILWLAAVLSVAGQAVYGSNVTQCIASFAWSINSLGQTPCLVAAALESACGTSATVAPIPAGNHYLGPTLNESDACRCSSVTYSLMSACGGCQDRTFIDWLTWSADCSSNITSFTTFPESIPNGTVVPSWAYLDLSSTNNYFSVSAAEQNSTNSTSSSATTISTSISSSLSTPSTSPSTSASESAASTSASSRKLQPNAGAIAGSVVGGLALVAFIALMALWCFLRKKKRNTIPFDSQALLSGPSVSQATTSMQGPSPIPSQSIYTSDMSGPPLTTSGIYTTIPQRSLESASASVAQLVGGPQTHGIGPAQHGYKGRPEV